MSDDDNSGAPLGWKMTLYAQLGKLKAALSGSEVIDTISSFLVGAASDEDPRA